MLLTADGGRYSGTLVDPVGSRYRCPRHHSPMYHFCPSSIQECACEFSQVSVCAAADDGDGDRVVLVGCPHCHARLSPGQVDEISYDPHCDTFLLLPPPPWPDAGALESSRQTPSGSFVCGRLAAPGRHREDVLCLGGYTIQSGKNFSLVHCNYDLQVHYRNYVF